MSIQAMVWALEQQEVKEPAARHVLLCLANYADKEGRGAFPSSASLSQDTGLSVRTVKYKLDSLEAAGLIRRGKQAIAAAYIDRADRRPTVYDIAMQRGAPPAPGSERGANEDATGCSSQQDGVQLTTERGAAAAPNPSLILPLPVINPEEQHADARSAGKGSKFDPMTAKPSSVSADVWADWVSHRKEIGKRLTETSCRRQAKALEGHATPDAVILLSISNGWTGLFPEKVYTNVRAFPQPQQSRFVNIPPVNAAEIRAKTAENERLGVRRANF